jgi:hypothetical protein
MPSALLCAFAAPYGIAQLHLSMCGLRGRTATASKIRNRVRVQAANPAAIFCHPQRLEQDPSAPKTPPLLDLLGLPPQVLPHGDSCHYI